MKKIACYQCAYAARSIFHPVFVSFVPFSVPILCHSLCFNMENCPIDMHSHTHANNGKLLYWQSRMEPSTHQYVASFPRTYMFSILNATFFLASFLLAVPYSVRFCLLLLQFSTRITTRHIYCITIHFPNVVAHMRSCES